MTGLIAYINLCENGLSGAEYLLTNIATSADVRSVEKSKAIE